MIKKQDDFLDREAKKIGYEKLLTDLNRMMQSDITQTQKAILTDQQTNISERLKTLCE